MLGAIGDCVVEATHAVTPAGVKASNEHEGARLSWRVTGSGTAAVTGVPGRAGGESDPQVVLKLSEAAT